MARDDGGLGGRPTPAQLMAAILSGSWRAEPPAPEFSAGDLGGVSSLLKGSGAGALAWWKIRRSGLSESEPARALRGAYHRQTLQHALQEREIEYVFRLLRSRRIEPVLLKGWAAAALYPERGLRQPGDIDLCVRPEWHAKAMAVPWEPGRRGRGIIDLTHDPAYLLGGGSSWDDLYARSRLVPLNDSQIRVLGLEDQLRFLCLHLLKHSAYRPLWLCDVAAALEAVPDDFDWRIALGGGARERNWVACVLDLARQLLGACRDLPEEVGATHAPPWLVKEVRRQWERPSTADHMPRELMAVSLRHPARALPALLSRWPDPIRALVRLNQPFDERSRLPRQLKLYVVESAAFLRRLLRRADQ